MSPMRHTDYVARDYKLDPETDILIKDAYGLRDGMVVLIANPDLRVDTSDPEVHSSYWRAKILARHTPTAKNYQRKTDFSYECDEMDKVRSALRMNRWCKIANVVVHDYLHVDDSVAFVGIYEDGSQFFRFIPLEEPWIAKKESINAQGQA